MMSLSSPPSPQQASSSGHGLQVVGSSSVVISLSLLKFKLRSPRRLPVLVAPPTHSDTEAGSGHWHFWFFWKVILTMGLLDTNAASVAIGSHRPQVQVALKPRGGARHYQRPRVTSVATALSYNRGCTIAQWLRWSLLAVGNDGRPPGASKQLEPEAGGCQWPLRPR